MFIKKQKKKNILILLNWTYELGYICDIITNHDIGHCVYKNNTHKCCNKIHKQNNSHLSSTSNYIIFSNECFKNIDLTTIQYVIFLDQIIFSKNINYFYHHVNNKQISIINFIIKNTVEEKQCFLNI